jgi:hypothetical protein
LFGQLAVARYFVAMPQPASRDGFHDLPHDLAIDGNVVGRIDDQLHHSDIEHYITGAAKTSKTGKQNGQAKACHTVLF